MPALAPAEAHHKEGEAVFQSSTRTTPEEKFLTWRFEPDAALEGTNVSWILATLRGHDLWNKPQYGKMMEDGDYAQLTDEQISGVIAAA